MSIRSFTSRAVEDFFVDGKVPRRAGWSNLASVAARKLDMLDAAVLLTDLAFPPNNRLEALKRKLKGLHSIRINDQWRVIFYWTDEGPEDVDIVDYHKEKK